MKIDAPFHPRFDEILTHENQAVRGTAENFQSRLREGLAANKRILQELLGNLKEEGFVSLEDLQSLEKGYLSKILHIVAHLQDGFIGIDSRFYNFEEDSHSVSRNLRQKIASSPDNYWILKVKGRITSVVEDPLDLLRTFEGRIEHSD